MFSCLLCFSLFLARLFSRRVQPLATTSEPVQPAAAEHHLIQQLYVVYNSVNLKNLQEAYHDAFQLKDESLTLFTLGLITLEERAKAEELYWYATANAMNCCTALNLFCVFNLSFFADGSL
jgi:arginine decarboxylase-like protein